LPNNERRISLPPTRTEVALKAFADDLNKRILEKKKVVDEMTGINAELNKLLPILREEVTKAKTEE
jgi:hypothetical protein